MSADEAIEFNDAVAVRESAASRRDRRVVHDYNVGIVGTSMCSGIEPSVGRGTAGEEIGSWHSTGGATPAPTGVVPQHAAALHDANGRPLVRKK